MTRASVLLLAALVFFLWMFLAAEPLESLADAGLISGSGHQDIRAATYLFAARWRHGMTSGWPLYMPGFFAVAITAWFWAMGRTARQMFNESASLMLIALLAALVLQPMGTQTIVNEFQQQTGLVAPAQPPGNTALGVFRSVYTLVTFAVGIVCIQRAIAFRRLLPLAVPVAMNIILASIRPWTVGDFTHYWLRTAVQGDPVANLSFLAVALTAAAMVWSQRITWSRSSEEAFELLRSARQERETGMSE